MGCLRQVFLGIALVVSIVLSAAASAATRVSHDGDRWSLENSRLRVTVDASSGRIGVTDKAAGYEWQQLPSGEAKGGPRLRSVHPLAEPRGGIGFETDAAGPDGKPLTLQVALTLLDDAPDLAIEIDMAHRDTEIRNLLFPEPFALDTADAVLVVADYCNGHLYPLAAGPLPRRWFEVSRLDMPWVGVCDLTKGLGYALIVETTDDAFIQVVSAKAGGRELAAPRIGWEPSKKTFAYARRCFYHFASGGGYVALAKRYRAYAQQQGLVVPFAEKLKKNPNIARLFGAPDVWGDASLAFARQAKAAGVEKMILHGRTSPADMKAINALGYLTSEYDNYTDVLPLRPGGSIDSSHDHVPESVVLKADGQRMTAWLTFDKKEQYMKRCPALWVRTAKEVVPKVLSSHPFLGRFIDVTTAEGLYECYDPGHSLSRSQKRECGVALLGYVRSLGLVTGGEHGIWWAVPHLDYIEGMMSGGSYSWPAGHLIRPKSKDQSFTGPWGEKYAKWDDYARWGVGAEYRVPLWELVFHDCIVSTWYWGDASDFLLAAAPEITPKKDAFNILYGTIPLLWASEEGGWHTARQTFLRTYRNTCKLHEQIAGTEMLSHEFLTPDRAVQRTRFSDGTEAIVNFGPQPYTTELAGKRYVLPQNGFAVKGAKIEQSRSLVDGRPTTVIHAGPYQFTETE